MESLVGWLVVALVATFTLVGLGGVTVCALLLDWDRISGPDPRSGVRTDGPVRRRRAAPPLRPGPAR